MNGWDDLAAELDAWVAAGRQATFWWRDDDAIGPDPALDRLFDLLGQHGIPLALAVIPEPAAAMPLPAFVTVLLHGVRHRNNAPPGAKRRELGDLPPGELLRDLERGRDRLAGLFGPKFLPVLVPPWNRIDAALIPHLSSLGLAGLSTFGRHRAGVALRQVNCHGDPIDWHGSRGFCGLDSALASIIAHLNARRLGVTEATEATGLLTHHLNHDEPVWNFVGEFAAFVSAHRGGRWLTPAETFTA